MSSLVPELLRSRRLLGRDGRLPVARAGTGLRAGATAVAWLYLYAVLWLGAYTVLSTMVFGWSPVLVTGGSMRPGIAPGDLVLLADVEGLAGRGSVLTFEAADRGDALVTHRVEAVTPDGYRTRGDANATADPELVDPADVVGVGRLLVPVLGRPVLWFHSQQWLPLGVWLAGTSVALVLAGPRPSRSPAGQDAAPGPLRVIPVEPVDDPAVARRSPAVTVLPTGTPSRSRMPAGWIPRPRAPHPAHVACSPRSAKAALS